MKIRHHLKVVKANQRNLMRMVRSLATHPATQKRAKVMNLATHPVTQKREMKRAKKVLLAPKTLQLLMS